MTVLIALQRNKFQLDSQLSFVLTNQLLRYPVVVCFVLFENVGSAKRTCRTRDVTECGGAHARASAVDCSESNFFRRCFRVDVWHRVGFAFECCRFGERERSCGVARVRGVLCAVRAITTPTRHCVRTLHSVVVTWQHTVHSVATGYHRSVNLTRERFGQVGQSGTTR